MAFPSPQKSLDETMGGLRLATTRPAWMATAPKAAAATPTRASPMKLSSSPKRARLSWAADTHSPTSPPDTTPKKPTDSGDEFLFEEVEQQQPSQHQESTSVLEELCFGTMAGAYAWGAPNTPPFIHPASPLS